MTKRRLTLNDSNSNLNKRRNLTDRVVGVQEAIHVLLDYLDTRHSSSHDEQVILQSTAALEFLEEAKCALLVARARARGNQGRLSEAVSDALEAINHHPTSAEGYLTAGKLYSMQGKQQEAVDIFERGLCKVLPAECPPLYDGREKAKSLLERRVDFVATLPAEITAAIFERLNDSIVMNDNKNFASSYDSSRYNSNIGRYNNLDADDDDDDESTTTTAKLISSSHINCTFVSKRWRAFVLEQCPTLWKTAKVGIWDFVDPYERFVPSASKNIQQLILSDEAKEQIFERLVDMAGKDMFQRTRQLTLQFDSWVESTKERLMLMFITLLRRHLTKLSIEPTLTSFNEDDMREEQNTFPLAMLLSLCTPLEQLYLGSGLVFRYNPLQWSASYNLTQLAVNVSRGMSGLEQLITRCSQLRYLSMSEHSPRILAILDEYCSQLRYLYVKNDPHLATDGLCHGSNDDNNSDGNIVNTATSTTNKKHTFAGLYELRYNIPSLRALQSLVPFFIKSKDTLKTLDLHINATDGLQLNDDNHRPDQQIHPSFGHVVFSQLKVLKLHVIRDLGGQLAVAAASMMTKCSVLEYVRLCFPDSPVPDRFFTSLADQPKLRQIIFKEIDFPTRGTVQLFSDRATRSKNGTPSSYFSLQHVAIKQCRGVTHEILNAMADVLTLRVIQLGFSVSNVSTEELSTTICKLRTLPKLKFVFFSNIPRIMNDSIILQLTAFDGLKGLVLDDLADITDRGIHQVVEQSNSLKYIGVSNCPQVSQETEYFLYNKFPSTSFYQMLSKYNTP
ncbi:hypothetical protein BDA99DRAFT_543615 [Phascolomyces articulosus]|uniref:F-box domain-containing protein n=1 Tax=Phascolomyces articulosus TaxID=60185 RepID=A0AAD5JXI9_9FUNG|nr:hypothetical protein BDA99DRAFT_543615 [Phascolomyces articulosus]